MRDYGKNGKKCKHAYADGGKVVREQRMQEHEDRKTASTLRTGGKPKMLMKRKMEATPASPAPRGGK